MIAEAQRNIEPSAFPTEYFLLLTVLCNFNFSVLPKRSQGDRDSWKNWSSGSDFCASVTPNAKGMQMIDRELCMSFSSLALCLNKGKNIAS